MTEVSANPEKYKQIRSDDEAFEPPPLFGNFFEGWSSFFSSGNQKPRQSNEDASRHGKGRFSFDSEEGSTSSDDESSFYCTGEEENDNKKVFPRPNRRKSSVRVGKRIISELLENENVSKAIRILQKALDHLETTQVDSEDGQEFSRIYSQIIHSLCDPNIYAVVKEVSKRSDGEEVDIRESVMWRLFTKVVESGYVLQTEAHLAVVNLLIENENKLLALQAMYALPRREWDITCYRIAILLHLMQEPKQVEEAQGLLFDYGRPYLDIANPIEPNDLPPIHIEMPLMKNVTELDQFNLWMFYQAALSNSNSEWNDTKEAFETTRQEYLEALEQEQSSIKDWAMEHLHIESRRQQIDRMSTEHDNAMIYSAIKSNQFEYGWHVYEAMEDAVNESTPCIVMHLCWVAFRQIPFADISRRKGWEERGWSVYSRFMCSEYLHPEQTEAPSFLHDILSIAANSPESTADKKARYTKTMSVYQLLVRLELDKLLCNDRVLEPILCTLLYECKGVPSHVICMCNKAFELWDRKVEILRRETGKEFRISSVSIIWALLIFCLRSGDQCHFEKILQLLLDNDVLEDLPSSLLAPIQTYHDKYQCEDCYFTSYMFKPIAYTDKDLKHPIYMDSFGLIHTLETSEDNAKSKRHGRPLSGTFAHDDLRPNIDEIQTGLIATSVIMGPAKHENMLPKQMYFSTKKAKAVVRHCLKRDQRNAADA
ncbi:hypothetical protein EDC96DRAFT_571946 [Choanephora cucurbitarum]|nr:hypothetical protein EDC96DRAFT_571946 [Choanephora cucurbitarum]